jgi:hypothetical protein
MSQIKKLLQSQGERRFSVVLLQLRIAAVCADFPVMSVAIAMARWPGA